MAVECKSKFEAAWVDGSEELIIIKTGDWRAKTPRLMKGVCRQCGLCYTYCPVRCLSPGKDGYFHPDLAYCKGCGICAYECPAHAIRMVSEEEE
jgi:pyruvate ferredoxin oxidoreductase delta subunit